MAKQECLECKRGGLKIVARGMCGTCYARSRKTLPKLVQDPNPQAVQGEPDFNLLFSTIRQMCKAYRSIRKQNVKLIQKHSNLKMKFIVLAHKKWQKKYAAAMREMQAAIKDLPEPEIEEPIQNDAEVAA